MKTNCLAVCLLLAALTAFCAPGIRWVETGRWSGNGFLETQAFPLEGDSLKVAYASRRAEPAMLELVDLATGETLVFSKTDKRPVSTLSLKLPKITVANPPRRVFLRITGAASEWTVIASQFVSELRAYEIFRRQKAKQVLNKYGVWCGDGIGKETIPLTIPGGEWKVTLTSEGEGSVFLKCTDAQGRLHATTRLSRPGTASTWLHTEAGVVIEIESTSPPWMLTVETP